MFLCWIRSLMFCAQFANTFACLRTSQQKRTLENAAYVGEIRCFLPVSVELLMVLFAVEMADWLVTGVPTVVTVVVDELFGERAALAAWTCACACRL